MKYKDWLDVWFANYIEPSSKTKTCERYSEIIEKHLKVKLGEYELEELSPIVIQKYNKAIYKDDNCYVFPKMFNKAPYILCEECIDSYAAYGKEAAEALTKAAREARKAV